MTAKVERIMGGFSRIKRDENESDNPTNIKKVLEN